MSSLGVHSLGILIFLLLLSCSITSRGQQLICENRSPEGHTSRKTEGDGGFKIIVVGNYSSRGLYAPNDVYTVTLQGTKTHYTTQKLTEFLLVAESDMQPTMGQTGLMTTGVFHIIDDSHSRYSDMCPDGVTNVNMQPKTEISVLWTAPSTLVASCIYFKATVVERPHVWYQDDGDLTKKLCPEMPAKRGSLRGNRQSNRASSNHNHGHESEKSEMSDRKVRRNHGMIKPTPQSQQQNTPQALGGGGGLMDKSNPPPKIMEPEKNMPSIRHIAVPPVHSSPHVIASLPSSQPVAGVGPSTVTSKCCACDEAKYEVRFEGIWSKETHPKDFPENEWLLHFSDIIGASHSPDLNVWKSGEIASEGIRQVAEWGATRHLETELKSKSRFINTIIKAKGLWHPDERGTTSAAFRVDKQHHLMSLVSMIGPSPDWIVGISSFDLCLPNCTWREEADFDLYPFDAGTDSGITYMSPNTPTEPRHIIRPLTSTDPNDPRSPFYGIERMQPFAKAVIRRQRIYAKHCNDTSKTTDDVHEIYLIENSEDSSRPECAVSEWTSWSDCSVTCGKGLRMRKRSYLIPMKADMFRCDRQLVEKEMCLGVEPSCGTMENTSVFEEFDSICAVTPWSDWTPCSVTCGKGTRTRSRRYKNHMGRKKCNLEMTQTEMCVISMECARKVNESEVNENCPLTPWSQWTPCSVTCGIGIRERTRFPLLTEESEIKEKCGSILTSQRATCTGEFGITCKLSRDEAREICSLPPDVGSCRSNHTKYFFSVEKTMCVPFEWSGCKGNRNRFESLHECTEICGFLRSFWNQRFGGGDQTTTPIPTTTKPAMSFTFPTPATAAEILTTNSVFGNTIPATQQQKHFVPIAPTTAIPLLTTPTTLSSVFRVTPTTPHHATQHHQQQVDLSDGEPDDDATDDYKAPPRQATVLSVRNVDNNRKNNNDNGPSIDCVVSRWSSWSECSVTCGLGLKTRTRNVLIHPQNGGKLCPRLQKRKSCRLDQCTTTYSS